MATSKYLTDLTVGSVSGASLIHIVNTGDTSQGNPAGSSYKAPVQSIVNLFQDKYITTASTFNSGNFVLTLERSDSVQIPFDLSPLSSDTYVFSGSYDSSSGTVTFLNTSGGTFQVNGFASGFTDIKVSAFTNQNNVFTIYDTSGNTFSTTLTTLTGLTISGNLTATTISATTYLGITGFLPLSGGTVTGNVIFQSGLTANTISAATYLNVPRITGGTYSNGTLSLTSNTGVTINVTGFSFATSGSTIYSTRPSTSNFNTTNSFFVGSNAGSGATLSSGSTFIGLSAGANALSADSSNFFGIETGFNSTKANYSNFFGYQAGRQHTLIPPLSAVNTSNFFGYQSGYQSFSGISNSFFGYQSGYQADNIRYSNFLGWRAGYSADNSIYSNFIGYESGFNSRATYSNLIGFSAGQSKTGNDLIYIGRESGGNNSNSIAIGFRSSYSSSGSTSSVSIGDTAGASSDNSINSIFIGTNSGNRFSGGRNSVMIGRSAGSLNVLTNLPSGAFPLQNSILIGNGAGSTTSAQTTSYGSGNVIIGSLITLPSGTTDSLNIGGVLFGSGLNPVTSIPTTATTSNGKIGIRVQSPTATLDINGTTGYNQLRLRTEYTPSSSVDANGQVGDFAWDSTGYFYIKTNVGWKRVGLSGW